MNAKRMSLQHSTFAYHTALLQAALTFATALIIQLVLVEIPVGRAGGVSLLIAVAGGLFALLLARRRQRRIAHLTHVAEAWLRGNLALRAAKTGHAELAALAENLNHLIDHLEADERDLERLGESNARLTDQVRALAVVEERNRLARELHDTVKQHLFSLAMTAGAVRTHAQLQGDQGAPISTDLIDMVQEIEASAQIAQQETTRLINDLRPAPLQERGLAAALNDYTLIFGARQHLLIYLDVQCNDAWLPTRVTEALYRVAQEALHNVARHARATRVDVRLHCSRQRVVLTIEDNGIGFDTQNTRKGLGISSMQERVIALGGRLTVISQPGSGATVQAEVEIARQTAPEPPAAPHDAIAAPSSKRLSASAAISATARPAAWAWLGERLVIPVGQVWPWLPVEQERYLRHPTISSGHLELKYERRLLGLRHAYVLQSQDNGATTLFRLIEERTGYHWDMSGADWTMRRLRDLKGRAVLERNGQVLAALQYGGRQLQAWTDVIYDDRAYRLTSARHVANDFTLLDHQNVPLLSTDQSIRKGGKPSAPSDQINHITLHSPLPLPLIAVTISRILDEAIARHTAEVT